MTIPTPCVQATHTQNGDDDDDEEEEEDDEDEEDNNDDEYNNYYGNHTPDKMPMNKNTCGKSRCCASSSVDWPPVWRLP